MKPFTTGLIIQQTTISTMIIRLQMFMLCCFFLPVGIHKTGIAQTSLTQTIRGQVTDRQSQMPIPGATIVLRNFDPVLATTSGPDGNYRIDKVPVGRISIECAYLGYHTILLEDVILRSGKELLLNFQLDEKSFELHEVVVSNRIRKDQPVGSMAMTSARSFTLEETGRYAGSYGDPARMASNYAGIMTGSDNRNDILIRGNSPMGVRWRLDDIEIANPSHYAATGTTGGPITILNTNLLSHSDFLTGAFPAEYGNALAGIFDLKMRSGNNQKREFWLQTGWNGLEFGTEGPFSKKQQASYILAYRYSLLHLLNYIGFELGIDPMYQDLNFKINLPYEKGRFHLIGIGGSSNIHIFDQDKKQERWMFDESGENIANGSKMGMMALSNLHFFSDRTRLLSSLSVSGSSVSSRVDTFNLQQQQPFLKAGEMAAETNFSFSSVLQNKLSARSDLDVGVMLDHFNYDYRDSTYQKGQYVWDTDAEGYMQFYRFYGQLRHRFTPRLLMVAGLHFQQFSLNNARALEPRIGFRYELANTQTLSLGFGMHAQMQARMIYFAQSLHPDGTYSQNNLNLDFSRSRHYVLGHDWLLAAQLRLKTEVYLQQLYDIPVHPDIGAYSLLNAGVAYYVGRQDSLVNLGSGQNYGIEFTLERFFHRNYFFLITASLFHSTYKGYDGVSRSTAFNANYLFNLVGGYEIPIGKEKNAALILGSRLSWNGGRPYIPYDVEATVAQAEEILDWANAYTKKHDDYIRFSFRFGMRRNKARTSSEFTFDLQYRTHYTNIYTERIDVNSGKIHNYQKTGFYPMSTWKFHF